MPNSRLISSCLALIIGYSSIVNCQPNPSYTDAEIEAALTKHDKTFLLYLAAAAIQGTDGMGSIGFDTWWRLCDGSWTKGVQQFLPRITDAQLGAFLKRYGLSRRGMNPRLSLSEKERASTIMPGESVTIGVVVPVR